MSYSSLEPRAQTLDLLGNTRNTAAIHILTVGLESSCESVRAQCTHLLINRPEVEARQGVIVAWHRFDEDLRRSLTHFKVELEKACKHVLTSGSADERQSAIQAVDDLDLTSALPELVMIAVEPNNHSSSQAIGCLLKICERWGQRVRQGQDVPSVRGPMLETMHRAICDFPSHQNKAVIEAWLLLVSWDDSLQRSLINDPMHPAFRAVLEQFQHNKRTPILHLLGGYLSRATTPKSILGIIAERPDDELALAIADLIDEHLLPVVLRRLRDMPQLASLLSLTSQPVGAVSAQKRCLWLMTAANAHTLDVVLPGAIAFSKSGTADGRRLAAEILRTVRKTEAEVLVQSIQKSETNPSDQTQVGVHLKTVLNWVDGPSTVLSSAAREFFADYTLPILFEVTRKWPTPLCKILASIVSRIDEDVIPHLLKELESPAPRRRILALQVIQMLEVTSAINEQLLPLVTDSRIEVRVRAIDLLAAMRSQELAEMLPTLLMDPTTDVQEAAARAQRRLQRKRKNTPASEGNPKPMAPIATRTILATSPVSNLASH